jgi:peptidase E
VSTHIIAMGGGGFMMEPDNPLVDEYVLAQATSPRPKGLFLPTAQGDSHDAIARFYHAFERFACVPTLLSIFRPFGRPDNVETAIISSDVVYVTGGATRAMLAVWRVYGIVVCRQVG